MKYLLTAISLIISYVSFSQISAEAKGNIDWGWTNYGYPKGGCEMDEIQSAPRITRGARNPRQCLEQAIAASKSGRDDLALRWILTIQCHNQNARNSIAAAGNGAVIYLMDTYGGGYKKGTGPTPTPKTENCIITVNNKSNKNLEIYAIRFKDGQTPNCESLTYIRTLNAGSSWTDNPLPKGWNTLIKFKESKSGGCGSSDTKFEINGIGNFAPTKVYDIH